MNPANSIDPSQPSAHGDPPDRGFMQLLRPPALSYIRELRRIVSKDPQYLHFHSDSVSLRIRTLVPHLRDAYGTSNQQLIIGWVKQAIISLSSFEKA